MCLSNDRRASSGVYYCIVTPLLTRSTCHHHMSVLFIWFLGVSPLSKQNWQSHQTEQISFWWLLFPFLRLVFPFLRLITILIIFLIRSPLVFSLSPGLEVTPMTLRCQSKIINKSKIIVKLLFFYYYFQQLNHKTVKQWHISRGNWDGVKYIFASGDIAWGGVEIVHQKAPRWKWVFSEYGTDSLESIIYQMDKC